MVGKGLQGWTVAGVFWGGSLAHLEPLLSLLHHTHELQALLSN